MAYDVAGISKTANSFCLSGKTVKNIIMNFFNIRLPPQPSTHFHISYVHRLTNPLRYSSMTATESARVHEINSERRSSTVRRIIIKHEVNCTVLSETMTAELLYCRMRTSSLLRKLSAKQSRKTSGYTRPLTYFHNNSFQPNQNQLPRKCAHPTSTVLPVYYRWSGGHHVPFLTYVATNASV